MNLANHKKFMLNTRRRNILRLFFTGCTILALHSGAQPEKESVLFAGVAGDQGLSAALNVFSIDQKKEYFIDGKEYIIGAGFQPSVLLDPDGVIHVFFQARLGNSGDRSQKMIAYVICRGGGSRPGNPARPAYQLQGNKI